MESVHVTTGSPSEYQARGDSRIVLNPASEHTHTPALAQALTSPGAPGAGAPTLEGAVGHGDRAGRSGSRWLRRAICLCSRRTSRWDSRSNRSKSRKCSHWGPSWGRATRSLVSPSWPLITFSSARFLPYWVSSAARESEHLSMHICTVGHISMSMQPHAAPGPWADIHNNSFTGRSPCACTVLNAS